MHEISGPLGIGLLIFGAIVALAAAVFLRRHEQALMAMLSRVRSTARALSFEQGQQIAFHTLHLLKRALSRRLIRSQRNSIVPCRNRSFEK